MKTVLCWSPEFATMWPDWCTSTPKGTNCGGLCCVCASVSVCVHVGDCFLARDAAVLLRAAEWRQSRARSISYSCRPRSMKPPWSTRNPADITAAAASEAASRSDCADTLWHWLQLMQALDNVKCFVACRKDWVTNNYNSILHLLAFSLFHFSSGKLTLLNSNSNCTDAWAQLLLVNVVLNLVKLRRCFVCRKRHWPTTLSRRPN